MSTDNELEGTPIAKITTTQSVVEPKYLKREITMVGLDSCGHCSDAESFINNELKPNSDIPVEYKKIDANSSEGQTIVDEKDLTTVPFIKECLIPKDPNATPECTDYKKFSKTKLKLKVNE